MVITVLMIKCNWQNFHNAPLLVQSFILDDLQIFMLLAQKNTIANDEGRQFYDFREVLSTLLLCHIVHTFLSKPLIRQKTHCL